MNKQIMQDMLIAFLIGLVTTMLFVFVLGFILGCNQIPEKEKEGISPVVVSDSIKDFPKNPIPGGNSIVDQQQFMIFHNLKRCWHNVESVDWSDELYKSAKTQAQSCNLKTIETENVGQNIAVGEQLSLIKAQDDWYMEFLNHPYNKSNGVPEAQKFTKIVWKQTKQIGCASNQCGNKAYIVCNYSPKPNQPDKFAQNVFWLKPDFILCTGLPNQ